MDSNFPIVFCVVNAVIRRTLLKRFFYEFSFFPYISKLGPLCFRCVFWILFSVVVNLFKIVLYLLLYSSCFMVLFSFSLLIAFKLCFHSVGKVSYRR